MSRECEHLRQVAGGRDAVAARTPQGCEECLAEGNSERDWVHLRLCLSCGHVGCCDSSPHRHASAHFAGTEHPVVRSFEPGETWTWCYVDETLGSAWPDLSAAGEDRPAVRTAVARGRRARAARRNRR